MKVGTTLQRKLRLLLKRIEAGKKIDGDGFVDEAARRRGLIFLTALIEAIETDPRGSARVLAETGRLFAGNLKAALDDYDLGSVAGMELSPDVRKLGDLLFHGAMRNAAKATASKLARNARSAIGGRESGVQRRKNTENSWGKETRCAAQEIILAEPALKKHGVATRVATRLAEKMKQPPDVKTITRFLDKMEQDGDISFGCKLSLDT
jgi:hypothetical protein